MSLSEQYDFLKLQLDPRKQVICVHVGMKSADGVQVVEPRVDSETGLPLLDIFLRKNMDEVRLNGWAEYVEPKAPEAVKPAARRTRKRK